MNKRRKDTLFTLCLHFQINFLQEITFFAPGETFIFRDNIMLSANLFSFNGKSLLNLGLRLMKQVLCPCDEFYEKEIQKALIFKIPRCILNSSWNSFDFSRLFSRCCSHILQGCSHTLLQGNNICRFLLKFNPVAGELELTALILHLSLKWYFSCSCLCDHFSTSLLQRIILSVLNTYVQRGLCIPCNIFFFVTLICNFFCLYFSALKYIHCFKKGKYLKLC